jgi:EpsD family peptidyl-prolyl cis-trans isomerase
MNALRPRPISTFRLSVVLAFSSVVLLACSKKIEEKTEVPNSQIVARVGNDVITTQELDNEFRIVRVPVEKRKDPTLIKQVLGELVTRKYMERKALEAKLDREPTVLLDLLRAREIVLANAQASREMMEKSSTISKTDVDNFIAKNPLKFADRNVVSVEQIVIPANAVSQALVDAVRDLKTLDDVDQKLTAAGIAHSRSLATLSSGDIPSELFDLIKQKPADNVFFLRGQPNAVFFKVNSVESHPLEGDEAVKAARAALQIELLKSEASLTAVEANLATKYEGEYADIMKEQAPATAPK